MRCPPRSGLVGARSPRPRRAAPPHLGVSWTGRRRCVCTSVGFSGRGVGRRAGRGRKAVELGVKKRKTTQLSAGPGPRAWREGKVSAAPAVAQARAGRGEAGEAPREPDSRAGPHCCRGRGGRERGSPGSRGPRPGADPGRSREGGHGRARAGARGARSGRLQGAVSCRFQHRTVPAEVAQRPAEVMRTSPRPQQAWLLPPDSSIV